MLGGGNKYSVHVIHSFGTCFGTNCFGTAVHTRSELEVENTPGKRTGIYYTSTIGTKQRAIATELK